MTVLPLLLDLQFFKDRDHFINSPVSLIFFPEIHRGLYKVVTQSKTVPPILENGTLLSLSQQGVVCVCVCVCVCVGGGFPFQAAGPPAAQDRA